MENFKDVFLFTISDAHLFGYIVAFLAALLETVFAVGLFLPGSTMILFLGVLAAQGYLNIWILFLFAVIGAVLGDNVNYFLGRKYGTVLVNKDRWFLRKKYFLITKEFFKQHGVKSVFFGRFVPSIKEIVPIIAGSVEMPKKKFFFWNAIGALGWGTEWLLMGYFFGHSLSLVKHLILKIGLLASIPLIISLLSFILTNYFLNKNNPKTKITRNPTN